MTLLGLVRGTMRSDRSYTRVELARLEGSMTTLAETVRAFQTDHENRLRLLERFRWSLPTAWGVAVLGPIVTYIVSHH